MTDQPSRPDPLSADFGGDTSPPAPPAPPATPVPPTTTTASAAPDPTSDRYSAFDADTDGATGTSRSRPRDRSRRRPRRSPKLPQATGPGPGPEVPVPPQPAGMVLTPTGGRGSARRRGRSPVAVVLVVLGALLVLPLVSGLVLSRVVSGSSSSDTGRDDPADKPTLAHETIPVEPSDVPSVPSDVREVRVEFQGTGRIVDVRLYSDHDGVTRLENVSLPYAVTVPVADPTDVYFQFDANDYGYRGHQAMSCTVSVGGVVVASSVGTRRVECGVTDSAWQVVRD